MTNEEQVQRNLNLNFEFLKAIIDNPKLLDSIEDGSTIEFVQSNLPIKERKPKRNTKYIKVNPVFEV